MRSRFAPSPTGLLHLGHIYAAQFAIQLAEQQNGECLLRFEDIDSSRVREPYYQQILDDLSWVDMQFPEPHLRQSTRQKAYSDALETLKQLKLVYPCFCTRKSIEAELAGITNAPHGPEGTHYPGICKKLSEQQISDHIEQGHIPSWRFDSERACQLYPDLTFTDSIHGTIQVNPQLLGDTILARKDIATSYHIAVVVDDGFQQITDVSRGNDLIHSTHVHRVLQEALNLPEPNYHHHDLILDDQGQRLAKRHDSLSLKALRESGHSPEDVLEMIFKQTSE